MGCRKLNSIPYTKYILRSTSTITPLSEDLAMSESVWECLRCFPSRDVHVFPHLVKENPDLPLGANHERFLSITTQDYSQWTRDY